MLPQSDLEMIETYKHRLKYARANLMYWKVEYAAYGDRFSKLCWLEAESLYLQIHRILRSLRNPILQPPSIEQKP